MKNPLRLVDRKTLKIVLGGFTLLTLISVIIIVLTVIGRDRRAVQAEAERHRREQQVLSSIQDFGMGDFFLQDRDSEIGLTYPIRPRQRTWSDEHVDYYWIDPSETGLGTLEEDNDRLIFESLGVSP